MNPYDRLAKDKLPARRRHSNSFFGPGQRNIWTWFATGVLTFFLLYQTVSRIHISTGLARPERFPKRIWQSWKVDSLHLDDRDLHRARTWTLHNPQHRYELLTDESALEYVVANFGSQGLNRPDIVYTYQALSLNLRIIQADLLRYMLMYIDGGVWADIDVSSLKPIKSFIPRGFDERNIDMVIGVETDMPEFADHPLLGSKAASFCQWTFMCKPRLPVMLRLIENIMTWLHRLADEQGKTIEELHLTFDEVLSGTGPSAFTNAILDEMSRVRGQKTTWESFHDLMDSKLMGGVLVLPSEAFAAGTGHSHSGNHGGSRTLVQHHFHASTWTSKHQRYRHPVFGEVERCNWDRACVQLWDANVAHFKALPEEEQLKMLETMRRDAANKEQVFMQ